MVQTRQYDGARPAEPTPQESRQGEIGRDGPVRGPMRYVLIVSTVLAIALLIVAYLIHGWIRPASRRRRPCFSQRS